MADPGFSIVGATDPLGGTDLRHVHFSVKMYAKTKEIDPVGGGGGTCQWHPPGSANVYTFLIVYEYNYFVLCSEMNDV